jgi:hypothetical protein
MGEEKEQKKEKKAVKGGLRATVALILSIFALLSSVYAVNRTVSRADWQNATMMPVMKLQKPLRKLVKPSRKKKRN